MRCSVELAAELDRSSVEDSVASTPEAISDNLLTFSHTAGDPTGAAEHGTGGGSPSSVGAVVTTLPDFPEYRTDRGPGYHTSGDLAACFNLIYVFGALGQVLLVLVRVDAFAVDDGLFTGTTEQSEQSGECRN